MLLQSSQVNDPLEILDEPGSASSPRHASSSWEEPLPLPSGASSEEEGVTTRQATRQKAGSLGIKQRGTKAQLLANIKDATSGQHTLASVWGKANVASQNDEQPALPAPDSGSDIIDASPVPQRVPGSASKIVQRPMRMRNKMAIAPRRAQPESKARRKACRARFKITAARKALDAQPESKARRKACRALFKMKADNDNDDKISSFDGSANFDE